MIWLRQLLSYGVTLGVIFALLVYAPRWQRQRLAPGFNDIDRFDPEAGFFSDSGRPFAALTAGDAIMFRSADRSGPQLSVGWVAAIAGDEIAIVGHRVVVGGKPFACGPVERPDTAGVVVPRGRIFVVSDHHQTDSVATGFIPAAAYLGSLGSLP